MHCLLLSYNEVILFKLQKNSKQKQRNIQLPLHFPIVQINLKNFYISSSTSYGFCSRLLFCLQVFNGITRLNTTRAEHPVGAIDHPKFTASFGPSLNTDFTRSFCPTILRLLILLLLLCVPCSVFHSIAFTLVSS